MFRPLPMPAIDSLALRAAPRNGAHYDRARSQRLELYTLDRRHFVFAVSGYQAMAREADTTVGDRLRTFTPAGGPTA